MLTVILLVVLAGGGAAVAVWLVDPSGVRRLLGRTGGLSLRAPHGPDTPPADLPVPSEPVPGVTVGAGPDVEVAAPADPAPVPSVGPVRRRRRREGVPAAFTAVEGTYRDIAVVPVSRKVLSLAALVVLVVVAGAVVAAVVAALLTAAAELVDGAVG